MTAVTFQVVLYALVAATSPLALGATVAVLKSEHGRINGAAFALAFVATQTLMTALAFVFDFVSLPHIEDGHGTLGSLLALAVGTALLVTAAYVRRHPRHYEARPLSPRTQQLLTRLGRLSPWTALGVGALLGIGGPKRLSITILVAATISAASLSGSEEVGLGIFYVLLATVLVWAPVVLTIVFGARATGWMATAQTWVHAHEQPLVLYPSLVLGVVLVVDAIVSLTS